MAETVERIIVIGAAGNIGRPITDALLATGKFTVSALTRASSQSIFPPSVTVIQTDYTPESLKAAFTGQDAVICSIATTNLSDQQGIVDAALNAGVKRFVPSDFGWDTSSPECLKHAPCVAMKRGVVDHLRSREKDGMTWTAFIPGIWFDWSLASSSYSFWDLESSTFTLFDDGNVPFEASTLAQVSKAVAVALLPENVASSQNQYVYVHSFTMTQNELLHRLERDTARKWTVRHNAVETMAASGQEVFYRNVQSGKSMEELGESQEFQGAIINMIVAGQFGEGRVNQFAQQAKKWMDKLGLVEEDPDAVLSQVLQKRPE